MGVCRPLHSEGRLRLKLGKKRFCPYYDTRRIVKKRKAPLFLRQKGTKFAYRCELCTEYIFCFSVDTSRRFGARRHPERDSAHAAFTRWRTARDFHLLRWRSYFQKIFSYRRNWRADRNLHPNAPPHDRNKLRRVRQGSHHHQRGIAQERVGRQKASAPKLNRFLLIASRFCKLPLRFPLSRKPHIGHTVYSRFWKIRTLPAH